MSLRHAAWLAWSMCATALTLLMAGTVVSYLLRSSVPNSSDLPLWLDSLFVLGFAAYPTVGALVASRRPGNAVGWLLCAIGVAIAAVSFTEPYTLYAREVAAGSLPGVEIAAFLDSVNPGIRLVIFIPLIFPDGRLPSRRWRPIAWLAGGGILLNVMCYLALDPAGADPINFELPDGLSRIVLAASFIFLFAALLGATASVLYRLLRARGVERQQIKWLVYAVCVIIAGALGGLISVWFPFSPWAEVLSQWAGIFWYVTLVGFAAIPIAVGIGILRYRLYDIDIIINRTLVYGALTAILGGIYFGGVTATQALFRALTGQEKLPQIAVVASTLVIAALFTPLRSRIQSFIDRRFYRSKYDARKTLEAFSSKLRDETDLEALRGNLVGVVTETMQPAHVSLWLRFETTSRGSQGE